MPFPGDVLVDDEFKFSDGQTGKKLFVVLNEAQATEPCLIVKTTSNVHRYKTAVAGCNFKLKVFFVPASQNIFDKDTYIQLDEIIPYACDNLLTGYWAKRIRKICKLPDLTFRQLRNCVKKFKQDIPEKYYALIC